MTKTYDFDAWYAQNEPAGPTTRPFRFGGKLWHIPVDPPAAPLLRMARAWQALVDLPTDAPTEQLEDIQTAMDNSRLLVDFIGQDMFEQWVALPGVTSKRIAAVASRLYRHYAGIEPLDPPLVGDGGADGEGKASTGSDETSSDGSSNTGL